MSGPRILALATMLAACLGGVQPAGAKDYPLPPAWGFTRSDPESAMYSAGLTDTDRHSGKTCGFLRSSLGAPMPAKPGSWGEVSQAFRADRYRGKHLRWTVWYKQLAMKGKVTLWWRVDGPNQAVLTYGRYVPAKTATGWRSFSDDHEIPKEAVRIALGVQLEGEGVVCFDDMALTVLKGGGPSDRADFEP